MTSARRGRWSYRPTGKPMKPRLSTPPKRPAKPMGGPRTAGRLQQALDEAARREIDAALKEAEGNVVRAANLLGISQPALYKRLAALAINHLPYRR